MASGSIRVSVELGLHELYAPLRIAERLSEPCRGNANADSGRPKGECSGGRRGLPPQSPLSPRHVTARSEEHTSELQSRRDRVCRLLLENKKNNKMYYHMYNTIYT